MPTDQNKSDRIEYPTPDQFESEPDVPLGTRKKKVIDGEECTTSEDTFVSEGGREINVEIIHYTRDAFHQIVEKNDYVQDSWGKHKIFKNNIYGPCINPFWHKHFHDNIYRMVLVNKDGYITELGKILCLQCYEYNEWLKRINWWCPRWLYHQQVF